MTDTNRQNAKKFLSTVIIKRKQDLIVNLSRNLVYTRIIVERNKKRKYKIIIFTGIISTLMI